MDIVTKRLLEHFQQEQDLTKLPESEAFEAFAGFCVLSSFYEDEFDPEVFRTGGSNDLGIDAYGILVNGELLRDAADVRDVATSARELNVKVVIVQAKTSSKFDESVISTLADNLWHVAGGGDLPYTASQDIENLCGCLSGVYDNAAKLADGLPRLHIRYVTTGNEIADGMMRRTKTAEDRLLGLGRFETVDFQCVNQRELLALYQRATKAVSASFPMPKKLFLPRIPGVQQSLQGLLSTQDLVSLLTDGTGNIRKSLFEDNVRDFQGYKNAVNSKIRDTLLDPTRRHQFAVLNNGITIVTRKLQVVGDDVTIRDFQIVNGCQTCHVLFHQRASLTPDVQVTVRIVHSEDEGVIGGIIAATNRQTVIKEEDLTAREEIHKRLEDYFPAADDKLRRLYYERRSKQYSERADIEKTRIISRGQLLRAYLAMFLDDPAGAGRYTETVTARGKELFTADQPEITFYTAAATHYRLEWLIRNQRISSDYRPARYHLLAAIRTHLCGATWPRSRKEQIRHCDRILDVVWDTAKAEQLVLNLLRPLKQAIDAEEQESGIHLSEMVRTQRFADRVRRQLVSSTH